MGHYFPPRWEVGGPDWIAVSWPEIHTSAVLRLRWQADSLVGDFLSGGGAASYWGPRFPHRRVTAHKIACDSPPVERTATRWPAPTHVYVATISARLGAPMIASIPISLVRQPGGLSATVEPGVGGVFIGAGITEIVPYGAIRLHGGALRTWGATWGAAAGQTFVGIEGRAGVFLNLSLGVFARVAGQAPSDRYLLTFGLGFGP